MRCAFSLSSLRSRRASGCTEASIAASLAGWPARGHTHLQGKRYPRGRAMTLPRVKLVATGGTIAMTGSPAHPAHGADELLAAVPEIASVASLDVEDLSNVPGANLAPAAAARAIATAALAVKDGAAGAVITQGTDTIEETAELAELVWPQGPPPLVITGAIRTGGALSADGPLNLLDSIRVV